MRYYILAGLGNPGSKYNKTRHNIGFRILDGLFNQQPFALWKNKFSSEYCTVERAEGKLILIKPQTYMNVSGRPVADFAKFFKVRVRDIIVFHDDIDLNFGDIRIKAGGSSGGHNGIKSLDQWLGSKDYHRIRFGVGRPNEGREDVSDYVLHNFSASEEMLLQSKIDEAIVRFKELLRDITK